MKFKYASVKKYRLVSESVSRKNITLEIKNKFRLECQLKRHLSPRTVGAIMRSLPLSGNAHFYGKNIVYLETPVESGIERGRKQFKKGEIAFLPTGGSICFFVDSISPGKSLTPIGNVVGDVNKLSEVKSGDVIMFYEG